MHVLKKKKNCIHQIKTGGQRLNNPPLAQRLTDNPAFFFTFEAVL